MQGVSEEDVMQEITSKAASMLQQDGVQVGVFHVPGEGRSSTDELQRMTLAAEEYDADVVFSLHSDSVRDEKQTGVLMLVYSMSRSAAAAEMGRFLAECLHMPFRGVRERPELMVLSGVTAPAFLFEIGEHGTPEEAKWLVDNKRLIAVGITDTILSYLGLFPDLVEEGTEEVSLSELFEGDGNSLLFGDEDYLLRRHADMVLARAYQKWVKPLEQRIEALEGGQGPDSVSPPAKPDNGGSPPAPKAESVRFGDFPVTGIADVSARDLVEAVPGIRTENSFFGPAAIRGLAHLYVSQAARYGLKADVLWCQMLHETNALRFTGYVSPHQFNFCGLKTNDGTDFAKFVTARDGVMAHVEHMAWYALPEAPVRDCGDNDPRHFGEHQSYGAVKVVDDLGGKWSPNPKYSDGIVKWMRKLYRTA